MTKKTSERPNAHTPKGFKQYPAKLKNLIADNKQLFIGLVVGIAIMLPTGVYVGAIRNNKQATKTDTPTNTTTQTKEQTKDPKQTAETKPTTEQSTNQSNNGGNSSQPSTTTGYTNTYKAPVCTDTPIAYSTSIVIASWLSTATTKVDGGTNGYTRTCTADSTGYKPSPTTLNPVNKTIYVGTGGITASTPPRTTPPEPDQLTRIKADCSVQLSVHGNQEAYQLCVNTLSRYFGL